TLSQVGEAFRNVGRAIKHAITELPSEVGARMYGGVFEFGSLYVAIVGTTFPPWFLGSETVEHLVLGAPLGMACTHLQLGYFVVIGKLLAPASMVCNYAFRDLSKEPWYKRLARIPKNLILAHQDYVRM